MVNPKKLAGIVLAVVALAVIIFIFRPGGDERQIKKRFRLIEQNVTRTPADSELRTAGKLLGITDAFAPVCKLQAGRAGMSGTFSPREVAQQAGMILMQFKAFAISFHDMEIAFPDETHAEVHVTVQVKTVQNSGDKTTEAQEAVCRMVKRDGNWLFEECAVVKVLK